MARTLAATQVVRVIRHELALLRGRRDAGGVDQLLRLADRLLERAALDDDLHRRRTGVTPRDDLALVELELGDTTPVARQEGEQDTSTGFESAVPPSLTDAEILDAFRHEVPSLRAASVSDVRRISGGFSKETIRAVVVDEAGGTVDVVIRKVAPGRRADGLRSEYDVVSHVASSGVPAPRPLWFQEDCSGTPAFAATGLPGGLLGDVWGWADEPAPSAVRDLGHAMGGLHSLDSSPLTSLPLPLPPLSSHDDHLAAIAERREVLEQIWSVDDAFRPVFERVLTWLEANAPEDTPTRALVHGDFGLHNILFLDGRLTGLLDWERAHLGNPAEDLAYLKPTLDQIGAWETFLASYQDAGGPPLRSRDLAYFSVWQDLWRAVSSFRIRAKFLAEPSQLSDAVSGLLLTPRFLARAAHGVLERTPNHDDWSVSAC